MFSEQLFPPPPPPPPPLLLLPLGYDPHNAAPFCPHFWNCKILERKDHKHKYMHPCVKGKSCDQLNDPYHTRFWYHLNLPTCYFGASCLLLQDPWHRAHYHHPMPKGVPALRDYMLNCDHAEHCNITNSVHRLTFQHSRPYIFPEDGVAPPFIPDHTEKMCKVCFKRARECTCEKKNKNNNNNNNCRDSNYSPQFQFQSQYQPQQPFYNQSCFQQSPPLIPHALNKNSLLDEAEPQLTSIPTACTYQRGKWLTYNFSSPISLPDKIMTIKWMYKFDNMQSKDEG